MAADTQYVIDIAADLTGTETIDQLDEVSKSLLGAGKDAAFFQDAIQRVSRDLQIAKAATAAANDALGTGKAKYAELERAALQASKAAERAGLKNAGAVPADLAAKAAAANAELERQAHDLRTLEQAAQHANEREKTLTQTLGNVRTLNAHVNKSIAGQAEALEKLRSGLNVAGPVGRLGSSLLAPAQGFAKLSSEMGTSKAAMLTTAAAAASLVAIVVALSAALLVAVARVGAWAVALADSARSAGLTREAYEAMHPELVQLRGTFENLTRETNAHEDELREWAGALKEAHVNARDMPAALRAVALSEAALGKGGSKDFLADLKAGKVAVSKLAAETNAKLGPIVARQMLGLAAQSERARRSVGDIFGGLKIEPVLEGLNRLVGLLDKNSESGQALKFLFESFFQPLIDQADSASLVLEAFVLGFEIGLVKLYIAAKPAIKAVKEFFGLGSDTSLTDSLSLAKKLGELVAPVFLVVVGSVLLLTGAVVGLVAAGVALGAVFIGGVVAAVYAVVQTFQLAYTVVSRAWEVFAGLASSAVELGGNIMRGLVNGIVNGAGAVVNAISGAVKDAISSAKKLLGIASPSKVFAEIGAYTAEGFAGGVESGAPEAQSSLANMVAEPAPALVAAASPITSSSAAASTAARPSLTIGSLTIKAEDGTDAADRFLDRVTRWLEGDAAAFGAAPEAT